MNTYTIKTRNFNCSAIGAKLLPLTRAIGVNGSIEPDLDGKFWLSTTNPIKAWGVWCIFMALRRITGGWTYIIRPGRELGDGYKAIY